MIKKCSTLFDNRAKLLYNVGNILEGISMNKLSGRDKKAIQTQVSLWTKSIAEGSWLLDDRDDSLNYYDWQKYAIAHLLPPDLVRVSLKKLERYGSALCVQAVNAIKYKQASSPLPERLACTCCPMRGKWPAVAYKGEDASKVEFCHSNNSLFLRMTHEIKGTCKALPIQDLKYINNCLKLEIGLAADPEVQQSVRIKVE